MKQDNARHDVGWTIQLVKQDTNKRRRYLILSEDGNPFLSVHEDVMIRFRLFKGQYITECQASEIRNEDERYQAYLLAIAYISSKPKTRKGITQYLIRKGIQEHHMEYALLRLESEQLVDDEQYARQYATSRMYTGFKGSLLIKQELQQKGISRQTAAEALMELDRDSELHVAEALAVKKSRSLKGDLKQKQTKLAAFLLRRGFPVDVAREAIRKVNWNPNECEDVDDDGVLLDN